MPTSRKGIQSARYLKKRRNRSVFAIVLFIVATASVVTTASLLSKADFLQIKTVAIVSSAGVVPLVTPTDQILAIVNKDTAGTWWHLFSKKNIFSYPRQRIRDDIIAQFPRVKSVGFGHGGFSDPDSVVVAVTERTPFALACTAVQNTTAPATCFYMDMSGFIYAPAPQFSAGVYVQYYLDETGTSTANPVRIGTSIDPAHFATAHFAVDYISNMGLNVTQIALADNPEYAMTIKDSYATSTATSTSRIYFDDTAPIATTMDYFLKFWQNETNKNFDYVDLRYGNDIVFKLQ